MKTESKYYWELLSCDEDRKIGKVRGHRARLTKIKGTIESHIVTSNSVGQQKIKS